MSVKVPNGTLWYIGSTVGSPKTVSALTNASQAVATSTAHGFTDGDYVIVSSGWSRTKDRVFRVDNSATNAFDYEGHDTTSTTVFPAGTGIGTATEVTAWTQVQQMLTVATEGGEQQFLNYQFVEDDDESSIPTNKAAMRMTFTIADDPTLAGYVAASAANLDREPRAFKAVLPNGGVILYYAYVSINETPSMDTNQLMSVRMTLALKKPPVRYATA